MSSDCFDPTCSEPLGSLLSMLRHSASCALLPLSFFSLLSSSTFRSSQPMARFPKAQLSTHTLFLLFTLSNFVAARDLTIKNNCEYTVWPALADIERSPDKFSGNKGWEAKSKTEGKVSVGSNWWGSVWARRDCEFDTTGAGTCITGESGGGIQGGMFPMTGYAEFYFNENQDDREFFFFFFLLLQSRGSAQTNDILVAPEFRILTCFLRWCVKTPCTFCLSITRVWAHQINIFARF